MYSTIKVQERHPRPHHEGATVFKLMSDIAIEVIGCLVEVVADDEGRIDLKCFEKIVNACVKSLLVGARVGDQAAALLKSFAGQVKFSIAC
jgi:hypothetical protein